MIYAGGLLKCSVLEVHINDLYLRSDEMNCT